jgi:TetR/AcrR family transcriptional regulator, regulator of cefoperazone and chloramphenicol sensitivity
MVAVKNRSKADHENETRQRLIRAGLVLFGAQGLDGVSTRQLAEAAKVNQAAIPYHFGGKEGVYRAVATYLVETMGARLRSLAATAMKPGDPDQRLRKLLTGFTLNILEAPDQPSRGGFIIREQLQPTGAFDMLYDGFMKPLQAALSAIVAELEGSSVEDASTVFKAHALLGQVLSFGLARELLFRRLGRSSLTRADTAAIAETVATLGSRALNRA